MEICNWILTVHGWIQNRPNVALFAISIPMYIFSFTVVNEFRDFFYCLHNWTCNISAAKRAKGLKMNVLLERVAFLNNLNCNSATKFDARGRSAQTFPLVHVFSATYERHICSATCRRNISSKVNVSMNINTPPSLLPNYRKLFL